MYNHDECKGGGSVFDAAVLSFTVLRCSPHSGHDKRLQHLGQYWGESDGVYLFGQCVTCEIFGMGSISACFHGGGT